MASRQWKAAFCGVLAVCGWTSTTWAVPLPAGTPKYAAVVSDQEACFGGNSGIGVVCGSSSTGSLDLGLTGTWGKQVLAQMVSSPSGFDIRFASVPGASNKGTPLGQTAGLSVVQFDDFVVTGPMPTVDITVTGRVVGSSIDLAGPSRGEWSFRVGAFNPGYNPDLSSYGDWVTQGPVPKYELMYSVNSGAINPTPNWTGTGALQVQTGQSFTLGLHFVALMFSLDTHFSEVSWSFAVPDGYSLRSANGLAVNVSPVPEPGAWALLLADLGLVGLRVRAKGSRRKGS